MSHSQQQHRVTVESIEDDGDNMMMDQGQQMNLASEDQEGIAPSDNYTAWREVDKAEAQARQERQQPGEAAHARKNATQTAHIIEDYIHHQRRI